MYPVVPPHVPLGLIVSPEADGVGEGVVAEGVGVGVVVEGVGVGVAVEDNDDKVVAGQVPNAGWQPVPQCAASDPQ